MTRSKPGSSATFMSLPQRGHKKRKADPVHVKPPSSPALSFSYSSASAHPTTAAPSDTPPFDTDFVDNTATSSSAPSVHKRRLIMDSDDEGQSDPGPSEAEHEHRHNNPAELNLIQEVLDSHPGGSLSPPVDVDSESHATTADAGTSAAVPGAALVGADQNQKLDSTAFPAFITIKLHFRRGRPRSALRSIKGWPSPMFILRKSDSYRVLMDLLLQHVDELKARKPENRRLVWPERTPYVQPTHSTNQQHYIPISVENYDVVLAAAWHSERRRLGAGADIVVKMFVYLQETPKSVYAPRRLAQARLRMEEANRINEAQARLRMEEANRVNNVDRNVGGDQNAELHHELRQIHATLALLASKIASNSVQPEQENQTEVPQSALYRPAEYVEEVRTRVRERQTTAPPPQQQHAMIRIKLFNDQWVPVMMNIGDVRKALELPPLHFAGHSDHQQDFLTRAPPRPDHVIDLDHEETHYER
ncbi:hypothetical protein EC968_006895 [Mortierella alpina]|nr:hypothetical protein EC968_006895 [Mortierella alpina]